MFEELLLNLKSDMMPVCGQLMIVAKALAGLGCLISVGMISIRAMADNEPFNPWAYLKPVSLGFCILFFDTLVVGGLDGILQPVARATSVIAETQEIDYFAKSDELEEKKSRLEPNPQVVYHLTREEQKADQAAMEGESELTEADYAEMARKELAADIEYKKTWIMSAVESILQVFSYAAKMVINIIGTFYLIILSILGPLAFAAACFPPLENSFSTWLSHYITTSLWLPIANLLTAVLSRANYMLCDSQIEGISVSGTVNGILMLAMMVVGIFGYFSVPSLANWIVQAGGSGSYTRNMTRAGGKAARVAGSKSAQGLAAGWRGAKNLASRYGWGFRQ